MGMVDQGMDQAISRGRGAFLLNLIRDSVANMVYKFWVVLHPSTCKGARHAPGRNQA